jgi:hypothetical protein
MRLTSLTSGVSRASLRMIVGLAGIGGCSVAESTVITVIDSSTTVVDAGREVAPTVDTGGAGICPARPDLVEGAPSCNTLVNAATAVPFTMATGTAPTPAGGAILDGLYESTRAEAYGATSGNGRRISFLVSTSGGATRMLWVGEVLDAGGTSVVASFRANTNISVSSGGTQINFVSNCVSSTPSPIPAALDFTVSGANLVLSLASGSTTAVTTYTRRGCAP